MATYRGDTPLTRFLALQTLAELRKMKADARNEIEVARSRVEELEVDLARIEQAIAEKAGGRRTSAPPKPAESNGGAERTPSLKEAIVAVLREAPDATWTTQDVYDELLKRSLAPGGGKPLNTVGNRLIELAKTEQLYRRGRGAYSLNPPRPGDRLAFSTEGGEND